MLLSTNSIRSFVKDSSGVSFSASPKHPQSLTISKMADTPVSKVKKAISIREQGAQNFKLYRIKRLIPIPISRAHRKNAINKVEKSKNSRFPTIKYSSSLYEKPNGSTAFIKPETM